MAFSSSQTADEPEAVGEFGLDMVLARLSEELADLAVSVDTLQAEIGETVLTVPAEVSSRSIRVMQDADRIAQTLRCVARVVSLIAPETTGRTVGSAELTEAFGLQSVADRVLLRQAGNRVQEVSGVDLFG